MKVAHVIKKQILEVTFPDKSQATVGQAEMSALCKSDLTSAIERVFDRFEAIGGSLRLDRLELDLGVISPGDLRHGFSALLEQELMDQLLREGRAFRIAGSYPGHGEEGTGSSEPGRRKGAVNEPGLSGRMELFGHYLATGNLPWWVYEEGFSDLNDLASELLEEAKDAFIRRLLPLLKSSHRLERLIYQLSDENLAGILEAISVHHSGSNRIHQQMLKDMVGDFIQLHKEAQLLAVTSVNFRKIIWKFAFEWYLSPVNSAKTKLKKVKISPVDEGHGVKNAEIRAGFDRYMLYRLFLIRTGTTGSTRSDEKVSSAIAEMLRTWKKASGKVPALTGKYLKALFKSAEKKVAFTDKEFAEAKRKWDLQRKNKTDTASQTSGETITISEEGLEINNAGLVIVAPFLPQFFDHLGLLDNRQFITEEAAKRGALLLQYIATREQEFPEHELSLNKLLCAVDLEEPVANTLEISDPEQKEVDDLMESVSTHWTALKGTSAEGIRATFLNKTGILTPTNGNWKLTVERHTVDIMIDRLPWSISVIKLPWMNTMINVEW